MQSGKKMKTNNVRQILEENVHSYWNEQLRTTQ